MSENQTKLFSKSNILFIAVLAVVAAALFITKSPSEDTSNSAGGDVVLNAAVQSDTQGGDVIFSENSSAVPPTKEEMFNSSQNYDVNVTDDGIELPENYPQLPAEENVEKPPSGTGFGGAS